MIVARVSTNGNADDAATALGLIDDIEGGIVCLTADAAYDTIAIDDAAGARGARVTVPPARTAELSRRRPRSAARDRAIEKVRRIGQRTWKKESGYHQQARAENAFFRYKSDFGDRLRAPNPKAQAAEASIACNILNRMMRLGRPASFAIGR